MLERFLMPILATCCIYEKNWNVRFFFSMLMNKVLHGKSEDTAAGYGLYHI